MAASLAAKESAWIIKHFEGLLEAERRRVNEVASLKQIYDQTITATQTTQLKATSDVVANQLDKVTTSLSDKVDKVADNIAATVTVMDKRLAGIEQFRYETGGRSSVSDPAMIQIAADLTALKLAISQASGQQKGTGETATAQNIAAVLDIQRQNAQHSGNQNMIAIAAGLIALAALALSVYHLSPPDRTPPLIQRQAIIISC